jgi:hypothetical protein
MTNPMENGGEARDRNPGQPPVPLEKRDDSEPIPLEENNKPGPIPTEKEAEEKTVAVDKTAERLAGYLFTPPSSDRQERQMQLWLESFFREYPDKSPTNIENARRVLDQNMRFEITSFCNNKDERTGYYKNFSLIDKNTEFQTHPIFKGDVANITLDDLLNLASIKNDRRFKDHPRFKGDPAKITLDDLIKFSTTGQYPE